MDVPQTGQQERAAQGDDGGIGRCGAAGADLGDAVVIDDDGGVGSDALVDAVDEVGVGQDEGHRGTSSRAALGITATNALDHYVLSIFNYWIPARAFRCSRNRADPVVPGR